MLSSNSRFVQQQNKNRAIEFETNNISFHVTNYCSMDNKRIPFQYYKNFQKHGKIKGMLKTQIKVTVISQTKMFNQACAQQRALMHAHKTHKAHAIERAMLKAHTKTQMHPQCHGARTTQTHAHEVHKAHAIGREM